MSDVDRLLALLDAGESPALADLERVADSLRRGTRPRSYAEVIARWRIVVKIEQLGRQGETAQAVA